MTRKLKKEIKGFNLSQLPKQTRTLVDGALDIKIGGKIEKVGGLRMVGFSEQTLRKGLGTLQVILERNIRRAKDPAGFVESLLMLNKARMSGLWRGMVMYYRNNNK